MSSEKLMLSQQNSIVFVLPREIVYCQSDNCYTNIYLSGGRRILIVKSLTKFHKELPTDFIRVNQSYLINKEYIVSIDKKKRSISLTGDKEIPYTIALKKLLNFICRPAGLTAS